MSSVALWRSNLLALPSGRGLIVGHVAVPPDGFAVFTLTNPTEMPVATDGRFVLTDVPAVRQLLYVMFSDMAWEVPVEVPRLPLRQQLNQCTDYHTTVTEPS
ncbi:MAG: hypothetical protein K6356_02645 [Chloroflexus sp.]